MERLSYLINYKDREDILIIFVQEQRLRSADTTVVQLLNNNYL